MSCSDTDHRHARCPFRFRRRSSATRSTFVTQHRYTVTSHQNLVVADPFEDQDDSLRGRMDEV